MIATEEPWTDRAMVVPHLRGLVAEGAQVFSPAVDPELSASLLERRRRGDLSRDRMALREVERRLAALKAHFPEIEADLSDVAKSCRAALLRQVDPA